MTASQTAPPPQINTLAKIWREIKRPFRKRNGKNAQTSVPLDSRFLHTEVDSINHIVLNQRFHDFFRNIASIVGGDQNCLFIDIGANEGQTIDFAKHTFKNCHVISYEPLKSCIPFLENKKRIYEDFTYFEKAFSGNEDNITIHEIGELTGLTSSLPIETHYQYFGDTFNQKVSASYEVESTTLSKEISTTWKPFEDCTKILKIDTQGTELSIFENATPQLASGYFDVITLEMMTVRKYVGQSTMCELFQYLDHNGFILFDLLPHYREFGVEQKTWMFTDVGFLTEFDASFIHRKSLSRVNTVPNARYF